MGFIDRIKNLSWQDFVVLGLIVFIVIFGLIKFSQFKHLPSPLYGGDLYSHYGYAQNELLHGFWSDPYYVNELPTYPWFGHLLVILFKFVTGLSLMGAFLYFPIVSMSLSLVAYYLLGIQFFKNKNLALILGAISLIFRGVVDGHPNLLPWMVEIPLFLFFWLRYEENGKLADKLLMGVMLGLVGLTHIAQFAGVLGAFGFFIFVELIRTRKVLMLCKKYLPALLIAGVIIAPFYLPILLKYAEGVKNPVFQYNLPPLSTFSPIWMVKTVWQEFFLRPGVTFDLVGIIGLFGLVACLARWKMQKNYLILLFFIGGMLAPLHHYITKPLLNQWVLPYHLNATILPVLIFIVIGFRELFANIDKFLPGYRNFVKVVFILLLLLPMANARLTEYNSDQWVQYGRQLDPLTKSWLDFGDWAKQNTDANAVFLANDESSFAINAVSARKLMIVRRTHANYFVDIDKRVSDAALIFYGNNSKLRQELLLTYNVSYVLYDPMLFSGELKTRPEFESLLKQNGVQFERKIDRLDPSIANAMQFDLLVIPPQNISADFQSMLKPTKQFGDASQPSIIVFDINTEQNVDVKEADVNASSQK